MTSEDFISSLAGLSGVPSLVWLLSSKVTVRMMSLCISGMILVTLNSAATVFRRPAAEGVISLLYFPLAGIIGTGFRYMGWSGVDMLTDEIFLIILLIVG